MDYYFFTFRSITRAQLALRYLQAADMRAALLRTPKALATEGCGYVIRVRAADAAAADPAQAGCRGRGNGPGALPMRQSGAQRSRSCTGGGCSTAAVPAAGRGNV